MPTATGAGDARVKQMAQQMEAKKPPCPLKPADLARLDQALTQVNQALLMIEQAEQAGLRQEDNRNLATYLRDRLMSLKATYTSPGSAGSMGGNLRQQG